MEIKKKIILKQETGFSRFFFNAFSEVFVRIAHSSKKNRNFIPREETRRESTKANIQIPGFIILILKKRKIAFR